LRVIIITVQVRAQEKLQVKIYVGTAVEVLKKKERG
jgi:hypothetical protein